MDVQEETSSATRGGRKLQVSTPDTGNSIRKGSIAADGSRAKKDLQEVII
jgi:hypothetical protein